MCDKQNVLRWWNETLEHRWKKRSPLTQNVLVRGRDGLTLQGKTGDISPDGMFIRLAPHAAVSINAVVEVELFHCGCLRGWVVHAGDEGIGIMFRSIGSKEKNTLKLLLSEKSMTQRT